MLIKINLLWARVLFVLVAAIDLFAIFTPTPPSGLGTGLDKVGHFLGLGALAVTAWLSFPRVNRVWLWSALGLTAILLEVLQGVLVPVRDFSYLDMVANALGVLGAYVGLRGLEKLGVKFSTPIK